MKKFTKNSKDVEVSNLKTTQPKTESSNNQSGTTSTGTGSNSGTSSGSGTTTGTGTNTSSTGDGQTTPVPKPAVKPVKTIVDIRPTGEGEGNPKKQG